MKKTIICSIVLIVCIILVITNRNNILKLFYPVKYEDIVKEYSKKYEVDEFFIYAIIKAESNFNENANSNKGAKGLMQLMLSTANDIGEELNISVNEENIFKPQINIELGIKYISELIDKYSNFGLALAAYNAGSGKVDSWISKEILMDDGSNLEMIPYKETNNYVRKILRDYEIYKELYE